MKSPGLTTPSIPPPGFGGIPAVELNVVEQRFAGRRGRFAQDLPHRALPFGQRITPVAVVMLIDEQHLIQRPKVLLRGADNAG
jgi:hypothetical protein